MTKRQVRIDDDSAVASRAEEWGISFSAAANRLVRLGLHTSGLTAPAVAPAPPRPAATRTIRAGTTIPKTQAPGPRRVRAGSCRHPITRRIGSRCGLCGTVV